MAKRLKPGDVLALAAPGGQVLVQFIGKHPSFGDAVLVSPRVMSIGEALAPDAAEEGWATFFPAGAALARGLASVVAHRDPPPMPRRWRRPGAMSGASVLTWLIDEEDGRVTVREALTPEELRLPIASIVNVELLVDRVRAGWRPESEGAPRSPSPVPPEGGPGHRGVTEHYLYFGSEAVARRAAAALRSLAGPSGALEIEVQPAALGAKWLVRVTHGPTSDEGAFERTRAEIAAVVERHGGEYDGWESQVDAE